MIKDIFDEWRYEDAELLKTEVQTGAYESVDVEEAVKQAQGLVDTQIPGSDEYVIPLFTVDDPTPTNEYVKFDPAKDHVKLFDTGFGIDGVERSVEYDSISTTEIGQRLRFWLPSNQSQPEIPFDVAELPDDRVDPVDRLSDDGREAFFDELKQFVRSERDAELESNWETYEDTDLSTLIRRNRVSGPFLNVGKKHVSGGNTSFQYQYVEDEDTDRDVDLRSDESLFEGNLCILDVESNDEHFPIEVELLAVGDTTLTLLPDWSRIEQERAVEKILGSDETEIWLHELLNPVPFERRRSAIAAVERDDDKSALLTGQRTVNYTVNKFALPESEIELDHYQRLGLVWADSTRDVVCIHGPPGTGKTRTLTAYVEQAARRGQSVLVTAHSNQAVDNLLVGDSTEHSPEEDTLHAIAQDSESELTIARVGGHSRNRVVQSNYMGNSVSRANIVAATTSGAAQFDPDSFDVAVLDEATQASRPATAIVLNCARKLVLAGDHKQLPPYCADESMQEEDMHISLFEYLLHRYGEDISVQLRKQYRMNDEISQFPNESFYDGKLETAARNRDWVVSDLKPIVGVDIDGRERRQSDGNSYYNPDEAEAVAKQVKLLVKNGLDTEDIGVITAYSGQVGQIGHRVNQLDVENPNRVDVDTVDSYQGSEREAIIVSFVRSNDDSQSGFLEFPEEGPRRLNVALTRARKRLVVIGNWNTLGTVAPHRSRGESCADVYADLATHLRSQGRMLSR